MQIDYSLKISLYYQCILSVKKNTKWLVTKCPLFGGSTVSLSCDCHVTCVADDEASEAEESGMDWDELEEEAKKGGCGWGCGHYKVASTIP